MMIEGASIDHASHPRDIATAVKGNHRIRSKCTLGIRIL